MYVLLKLKQCNANPGITANSKSQDIKILQAADRLPLKITLTQKNQRGTKASWGKYCLRIKYQNSLVRESETFPPQFIS